jgi:hypothetical protein
MTAELLLGEYLKTAHTLALQFAPLLLHFQIGVDVHCQKF